MNDSYAAYGAMPGMAQQGVSLHDNLMASPPSVGGLASPSATPAPSMSHAPGQEQPSIHGLPPPPPSSGVPGGAMPATIPSSTQRADSHNKGLYVGGLDGRISEDILKQIFETAGTVTSVKIIFDKTGAAAQGRGFNYGFVEYDDSASAERAMQTLNGRRVHNNEIRVNWAYQSSGQPREDTSNHFHVFVGDLSNEVNDDILNQAFSAFGTISEGRVMIDAKTGRSRGYGFVAYRDRAEAEKALNTMDGEWLGSRAIRCNWANQRGGPSMGQQQSMSSIGMTPLNGGYGGPGGYQRQPGFPSQGGQSYEIIVNQTPRQSTTVYAGNLTPYTTQNDLAPLFQNYGYILESRFQTDRGFAFLKMDSHENAAMAICQLNGVIVNGRPLKCGWGKDRGPTGQFENFPPQDGQYNLYGQVPAQNMSFPQYGGAPVQQYQGQASYGRPQSQYGAASYGASPGQGQQNAYSNGQQQQYQQSYGQTATPQPQGQQAPPPGQSSGYSSSAQGNTGYGATSSYGY